MSSWTVLIRSSYHQTQYLAQPKDCFENLTGISPPVASNEQVLEWNERLYEWKLITLWSFLSATSFKIARSYDQAVQAYTKTSEAYFKADG